MQFRGTVWMFAVLLAGGALAQTHLNTISHGARLGINISITLSRQNYVEDCTLQTPQGQIVSLTAAQINGVSFFPTRTNFVSCRVVIGPIQENLLGTWRLCGRPTEGGNSNKRCQPANIAWATTDNPASEWLSRTNDIIEHPIHYGFTLSPIVQGGGGLRTCHVITPEGEDIALTADSDYPGLKRVIFEDDVRTCSVTFGPFNINFRGSWVLYGTFNSNSIGWNVATQPLTLFRSDDDDHNGNIIGRPTISPTINHGARLGTSVTITLSRKDFEEECHLQTPTGNTVQLENAAQLNGVQVYTTRTNFVSCRVVIGPMEESLLGVWSLCGKRAGGTNTYDRCQPANITWAASNPADNWLETTNPNMVHTVHDGFSVSSVVRGGGGIRSCHVISPEGEDIAVTADSDYPGLQRVLFDNDVTACSVIFGPLEAHFLGNWVLYGTFNSNSVGFNVAIQPITFSNSGANTVLIWSSVAVVCLVVLIVVLLLGPRGNREWTFDKTNRMSNSLRNTFTKNRQPYNRNEI